MTERQACPAIDPYTSSVWPSMTKRRRHSFRDPTQSISRVASRAVNDADYAAHALNTSV